MFGVLHPQQHTRTIHRADLRTHDQRQVGPDVAERACQLVTIEADAGGGEAKHALSRDIRAVYDDPEQRARHTEEYDYYPTEWVSPYIDRRRKVGWTLYSLLGIDKGDKTRMHAQHRRNYDFFDAPVGLIFTIDRVLRQGSWLDYGMFLENIMIAARARGLDTCPQAAFTQFHRIIRDQLALPDNEMVVCGMSLGYADMSRVENTLVTEREPVSGFARFIE